MNSSADAQEIPLPEHPRPDFKRELWHNLNGKWQFEFDSLDTGIAEGWPSGKTPFSKIINVPFPWGSELSGVKDESDIGWYKKEIVVSPEWKTRRTFLTIGASDWETCVWFDGQLMGRHQGGYTPFSFELTDLVKYGKPQQIIIRADDKRRSFTLFGKQGYGNARGIWQTVFLESRGAEYLDVVHFTPDIEQGKVTVTAYLAGEVPQDRNVTVTIQREVSPISVESVIPKGKNKMVVEVPIPNARLWTLEDPYLYDAEIKVGADVVKSYFGMRKVSVVNLPGTNHPYIALNNKPVYLQLTLDQCYHPGGYYTFPSDQFMKNEIALAKSIGLNGIRTHIKVEIPRKLYWADKLGILVMSDLPNSWGEPDDRMQAESEYTLREMIKRDYNHPSIFSWVLFNETWGLLSSLKENGKETKKYLSRTQLWVASMYYLAKSLDQTRLVEDNSICCGVGHTVTDINSFHEYLPGWMWDDYLTNLTRNSHEGSTYLFEKGFAQGNQPTINSECGNVWGYQGSTGDIDYSWDYHRMMNTFRKYPEVAGWLYTEHHDVINEWNGYWRFDRTMKYPGVDEIVKGMAINDFHAPVYLSTGNEICRTVNGGEQVTVPLYLSAMTDADFGDQLTIAYEMEMINSIGESDILADGSKQTAYKPWIQAVVDPLVLSIPDKNGLITLKLLLKDSRGKALHHNFMHFEVISNGKLPHTEIVTIAPGDFSDANWSLKQWTVLNGLKVNGAGKGHFTYTFPIPTNLGTNSVKEACFLAELSSKELHVKDRGESKGPDLNFMLGGKVAPSSNSNSYPMTDETTFPSSISISVNGEEALTTTLPDDPADHRGILSWHHQLKDKKLREAGSYGYLIKVPISKIMLKEAAKTGKLNIQIKTLGEGGVAVYGRSFGRYPFDPSLVIKY
jgi:hypothetical protein